MGPHPRPQYFPPPKSRKKGNGPCASKEARCNPSASPSIHVTKLTKSDWTIWTATLADNQADFETLTSPIYDYLNQTTSRSPFADSYITDKIHSDGMHARPVIGGVFIKMRLPTARCLD